MGSLYDRIEKRRAEQSAPLVGESIAADVRAAWLTTDALLRDHPSCTGYIDSDGELAHDGDTCPVHETPPRIVLVHLNISLPRDDSRTVEQIAAAVLATLEVGDDPASDDGLSAALHALDVSVALAEEI